MKNMREIKFRAWDNISKRMHNHIGKVCDNGKAESREDIGALVDGQNSGHYILHDCILMQYTGLKDKNGKEIYEGDIVAAGTKKGAVSYHAERGMWIIADQFKFNEPLYQFIVEIVGNVYEQPELITTPTGE